MVICILFKHLFLTTFC